MNWFTEAQLSWTWLHWMRQVTAQDQDIGASVSQIRELIRGLGQWDESIASDRHSVGDPDRISSDEYFFHAVSMMSRAAKEAIGLELERAIACGADDPMTWSSRPPEARQQWDNTSRAITQLLQGWLVLWHDLDELRNKIPSTPAGADQWKAAGQQATDTMTALHVAARAQYQ